MVYDVVVRPDGLVAWASDTTPSPEDVTRAAIITLSVAREVR